MVWIGFHDHTNFVIFLGKRRSVCCIMKPIVFLLYLETIKRFGFLFIHLVGEYAEMTCLSIVILGYFDVVLQMLSLREGFDDVTLWSDSVPFCSYGFSLSHEMEEGGYTVEYNCISLYQKNIFRLPIKKEKQCFRFLRFKLGSVCLKKIFCPFFDVDCRKHGDNNCVIFYVVISMPLRESQPPVYNSRLLTQIQWALSLSLLEHRQVMR